MFLREVGAESCWSRMRRLETVYEPKCDTLYRAPSVPALEVRRSIICYRTRKCRQALPAGILPGIPRRMPLNHRRECGFARQVSVSKGRWHLSLSTLA